MKELDLLVENYFTPALDATDILRLVEQVMNEVIDCGGTTKAMRFEWVVIATARSAADALPVPESLLDISYQTQKHCGTMPTKKRAQKTLDKQIKRLKPKQTSMNAPIQLGDLKTKEGRKNSLPTAKALKQQSTRQ